MSRTSSGRNFQWFFMVTADFVEPVFFWNGGDEYISFPPDLPELGNVIKSYLLI